MIYANRNPFDFETSIVYRESIEKYDKAIFAEILDRIADKFIKEHYEDFVGNIDIAAIAGGAIGNLIGTKVEEIIRREMEKNNNG